MQGPGAPVRAWPGTPLVVVFSARVWGKLPYWASELSVAGHRGTQDCLRNRNQRRWGVVQGRERLRAHGWGPPSVLCFPCLRLDTAAIQRDGRALHSIWTRGRPPPSICKAGNWNYSYFTPPPPLIDGGITPQGLAKNCSPKAPL